MKVSARGTSDNGIYENQWRDNGVYKNQRVATIIQLYFAIEAHNNNGIPSTILKEKFVSIL